MAAEIGYSLSSAGTGDARTIDALQDRERRKSDREGKTFCRVRVTHASAAARIAVVSFMTMLP